MSTSQPQLKKLCDSLSSLGHNASIQEDTQQVFVHIKSGELEFPLFCRFAGSGQFIQLIAFLPGNFSDETVSDSARLLHMVNREIDMPGFGMDEENKVAFYRLLCPARNGEISSELLEVYTSTMSSVMGTFANLCFAVVQGRMTLADVQERMRATQEGGDS